MGVPVWADDGLSNSAKGRILHMTSVLLWSYLRVRRDLELTWSHLREKAPFPLSLIWTELALCLLVADLCCSRAPVSSHKSLMSTDCRVTSLCSVIGHDVAEVPFTLLGSRALSGLGKPREDGVFPAFTWASGFFLFERCDQTAKQLKLCFYAF